MVKKRQSNFELLRIIAMFMVLVLHADFLANGRPDIEAFYASPLSASARTIFEMLSIVSVNVFVMISGWFGIRPSIRSVGNFIFQCLFFLVGIYTVALLLGVAPLSVKGVASCLTISSGYNWFIRAYLGLIIIAPILNTFLEHCNKRQLGFVLVSFYLFQSFYGFVGNEGFFSNGYSTLSFIGLYLLSRYLRLYGMSFYKLGGVIYIVSALCNTLLYYIMVQLDVTRINVIAYSNPLVVMGAAGLVMWIAQLKMQYSRWINFIAASSFAVYLFHTNFTIVESLYKPLMISLYERFDGLTCIMVMFAVLVLIFMLAVVLDQPRKWLWNKIGKYFTFRE